MLLHGEKVVVMSRVRSRNAYEQVSDFDKGRIVLYWDCVCGLSYYSIAAHVGRDPMNVSRIWNRWVQDGNTERRQWQALIVRTAPSQALSQKLGFCLQYQDGRIPVRWHRDERTLAACIRHRHTGSLPGMTVWDAICYTSQ
ncbi:uncharacterized protein TNCV_1367731 [Trichonephila clavipes]|nr:uncharacterized protein TNCV_1367731 [Trichonephila clavipes]